jgi:cell division protein FtsB
MQDGLFEVVRKPEVSRNEKLRVPISHRVLDFAQRAWRPFASVLAVALTALIVWHGVVGKNGLLVWQQKRVEDQQLRKEIESLNQENERLRDRVDRLKSNPDAIGVVARDKLHYTKPNEVIVDLSNEQKTPAQPAAGK